MAINKAVRAALRALSYADLNVKKHYRLFRFFVNLTHYPILRPLYQTWDRRILSDGYEIPVRIFLPKKDNGVMIFFHGGGWVTGNIDSYNKVCANMARLTNRRVISVDYRLAPEFKFPAAPEDCYAVCRAVFARSDALGIKKEDIVLIGDSAGANLAAAVSLMARDRGEFAVKKQILIYPATYCDHSDSSPFASVMENGTDYLLTSKRICDYMELYLDKPENRKNPYFAPLLAEDLSCLPDTLLITAQYDPLRDEGEAFGRKLARDGTRVQMHRMENALHGFFSLPPAFLQVRTAYRYINQFLSEEIQDGNT